jgi:hypothetical protein
LVGGALGLAILASIAAWRTDSLAESGDGALAALTGGYHAAFVVGALFAAGAALLSVLLLRSRAAPTAAEQSEWEEDHEPVAEAA